MDLINAELTKLKETKKPSDIVESAILQETPQNLKLQSSVIEEEVSGLSVENLCFVRRKNIKKNYNFHNSAEYFDDSGNYVVSSKATNKSLYIWYVKKDGRVEGSFSDSDIKKLMDDGKLTDTLIKRDFDSGFVEFNKLVQTHPHFLNNHKNLTQFFTENQIMVEDNNKEVVDVDIFDFSQNNKLKNFMDNNNITVNPTVLIKNIMGLKKQDAIERLKNITSLGKPENTILVELLIKGLDKQILCDVDKAGFMINTTSGFSNKNNIYNKNRKHK